MQYEGEVELRLEERLHRSRGRGSRSSTANARVTREEQEELENFAKASGKTLSEWAREVLLREARRPKDDAVFTEVVAIRMLLNQWFAQVSQTGKVTLEELTALGERVRQEKRTEARKLMRQYSAEPTKEQ